MMPPVSPAADVEFRPPSVPLVTVDPYFSVWSPHELLYAADTRHWTGSAQPLRGRVQIDDKAYRFLGATTPGNNAIPQTVLRVDPLSTHYRFEGRGLVMDVVFWTPLLLDDLELMSRPVSFIKVRVRSLDHAPRRVKVELAVSSRLCVNTPDQQVIGSPFQTAGQASGLRVGSVEQPVLEKIGDGLRIDWGYLYLTAVGGEGPVRYDWPAEMLLKRGLPESEGHADFGDAPPAANAPFARATIDLGQVDHEARECSFVLAYDDLQSATFLGQPVPAWWRREGQDFGVMLDQALAEIEQTYERCVQFNRQLNEQLDQAGGQHYRDIGALAYRQAIAAHKLVESKDGHALFFSKECYSNGCMGTVDVSYPSMPLFLLYNPDLVNGMLRPVLEYAGTDDWPFAFAPHDVGRYPRADGQFYRRDQETGLHPIEFQMPIEECANILVMTAAAIQANDDLSLAREYQTKLDAWATYLIEHGRDPGEQLCTDDFSGRLARNSNLAIKACVGVAAWASVCDRLGAKARRDHCASEARAMADYVLKRADDGDHYRLAYDQPGTWSLKYNLVWDRLMGLGLFERTVYERELARYEQEMLPYGIPLDSRDEFTKSDWYVWCASMLPQPEDFRRWIEPLWRSLHETTDRVPMTDWYYADTALQRGFQNRSVVGGLFIRLLFDHQKYEYNTACPPETKT
ncbi:MAG: DUF4965 domain-containing protein [Planctomycetota bacterium]